MPLVKFSKETASDMAKRSVQSRITKSTNRKPIAQIADREQDYNLFVRTHIARTQGMLDRLCLLFDEAKTDSRIDTVSRAYERIFGVWAHLTLTPAIADIRVDKLKGLVRANGPRSVMERIANDPSIIGLRAATADEQPTEAPEQNPQPTTTDEPAPTESETKESLLPPGPTVGAPGEGDGG